MVDEINEERASGSRSRRFLVLQFEFERSRNDTFSRNSGEKMKFLGIVSSESLFYSEYGTYSTAGIRSQVTFSPKGRCSLALLESYLTDAFVEYYYGRYILHSLYRNSSTSILLLPIFFLPKNSSYHM